MSCLVGTFRFYANMNVWIWPPVDTYQTLTSKRRKRGIWGKQTDLLGLYCEVLMIFVWILCSFIYIYSQNKTYNMKTNVEAINFSSQSLIIMHSKPVSIFFLLTYMFMQTVRKIIKTMPAAIDPKISISLKWKKKIQKYLFNWKRNALSIYSKIGLSIRLFQF